MNYGITGKLYKAISSCYEGTTCRIRLNQYVSDPFQNNIGVRQGDNLSPTLFITFINSLAEEIKRSGVGVNFNGLKVPILLYADDILLMADNEADLQHLLDIAYGWCRKWRLSINTKKTKILHVRTPNEPLSNYVFKFGENPNDILEYTKTYKYLGVLLDEHMNYDTLANDLAGRASKALGSLLANFYANNGMGFRDFKKCYDACITKISEYSAGVWGLCKYPKLDSVHNRALRCYLGVHKYAPIAALQGEMGFTPPDVRRKIELIRLWNHLISLESNRLPRKIFDFEYLNKYSWCAGIYSMFNQLNMNNVYTSKRATDLKLVRDESMKLYEEQFLHVVNNKPKLRTYTFWKENFCTENHVTKHLARNKRSLFAQLRIGILPLKIETCRF